MNEVKILTDYLCDDGQTAHHDKDCTTSLCDSRDREKTGATHYILLSRGYYWKDGPMAGLYVDSRNLTKPYKRREYDLIFPEPCLTQLSLFD